MTSIRAALGLSSAGLDTAQGANDDAIRVSAPLGWGSLARTTALRAAHPERPLVYAGPSVASPVVALQLALFDAVAPAGGSAAGGSAA